MFKYDKKQRYFTIVDKNDTFELFVDVGQLERNTIAVVKKGYEMAEKLFPNTLRVKENENDDDG